MGRWKFFTAGSRRGVLFLFFPLLLYGGRSSVGRALDCGSRCRGFESHRPPQKRRRQGRSLGSGPALFIPIVGCSQAVKARDFDSRIAGSSPAIPATSKQAADPAPPRASAGPFPPPLLLSHKSGRPLLWVHIKDDPVAQLVEHLPFKPVVRGSSPRRVTRRKPLYLLCFNGYGGFFFLRRDSKSG